MESASAFSVYASKRKNIERLLRERRKKRSLQKVSNRKSKKQRKGVKRMKTSANQQAHEEGIKSIRNEHRVQLIDIKYKVQLRDEINGVKNKCKKLNLKAMKERRKKNKKNSGKRKAIQVTDTVSTKNIEIESSDDDSNNLSHTSNLKRKAIQMTDAVSTKNIETESSDDDSSNLSHTSNSNNSNHTSDSNNSINETNKKYDYNHSDPVEDSVQLLKWLLHPMDIFTFLEKNWQRAPVYVNRNTPDYYKHIVSTPILDQTLRKNHILFTKNIDITSYSNGVRETHNPSGRALPSIVWDYYQNKCSVRMLNPQTFIPRIHALNATLQEFFNCFVGANLYLTPPDSQGFAPHYDDVEVFIMQIEGEKRWKLYKPLNENEYLPRYSSKNFDQTEIGEPILDTIVKAGDLLYLPRGTIHQAMTLNNTHSLHVTLSVYQKNTWSDFLEKLLPQALKQATENDCSFRNGLPLNYLTYVGTAYDASCNKDVFKTTVKRLVTILLDHIDIDNAADLMAKNHIHDFLPPFLFKNERKCTVAEDGEIMTRNGLVKNYAELTLETRIRLLRLHCIRLIKEDTYKIYYSTENSKEYHEYEPQFIEVDEDFVPGIKQIITSYPTFISVKELLIEDDNDKIQVVRDLWEKGLILTKKPLC